MPAFSKVSRQQAHYEVLDVGWDAEESAAVPVGLGGTINILPSRGGAERWMNSIGVGNFDEA
jgi:hypothetical protein